MLHYGAMVHAEGATSKHPNEETEQSPTLAPRMHWSVTNVAPMSAVLGAMRTKLRASGPETGGPWLSPSTTDSAKTRVLRDGPRLVRTQNVRSGIIARRRLRSPIDVRSDMPTRCNPG